MLLTLHLTTNLTVCEKKQFSTKALAAKGLRENFSAKMHLCALLTQLFWRV